MIEQHQQHDLTSEYYKSGNGDVINKISDDSRKRSKFMSRWARIASENYPSVLVRVKNRLFLI